MWNHLLHKKQQEFSMWKYLSMISFLLKIQEQHAVKISDNHLLHIKQMENMLYKYLPVACTRNYRKNMLWKYLSMISCTWNRKRVLWIDLTMINGTKNKQTESRRNLCSQQYKYCTSKQQQEAFGTKETKQTVFTGWQYSVIYVWGKGLARYNYNLSLNSWRRKRRRNVRMRGRRRSRYRRTWKKKQREEMKMRQVKKNLAKCVLLHSITLASLYTVVIFPGNWYCITSYFIIWLSWLSNDSIWHYKSVISQQKQTL